MTVTLHTQNNCWTTPRDFFPKISECLFKNFSEIVQQAPRAWRYVGKTSNLTRNILEVSLRTCSLFLCGCHRVNQKLGTIITRLKIFSIVSIPFNLVSIRNLANSLFKSYSIGDRQGVALNSLSFTAVAIDSFMTIGTFASALALTALNLRPFGFMLIGLGSLSQTVRLVKTHLLFKDFQNSTKQFPSFGTITPADLSSLKAFITKHLIVNEAEKSVIAKVPEVSTSAKQDSAMQTEIGLLQQRKNDIFLRFASAEIKSELTKIATLLESELLTPEQQKECIQSIRLITAHFEKKKDIDITNASSIALSFIGLSLFLTTVPPVLPFLFFCAGLSCSLASEIKSDRPVIVV